MSTHNAAVDFGRAVIVPRRRPDLRHPGASPERAYFYRARAIVHAVAQEIEPAFAEIEASWDLMPPLTCDHAADLAWIYLLSGDLPSALGTLKAGTNGEQRIRPRVCELLTTCVALDPSLWRMALGTALTGGTIAQRMHAALAVLAARVRGEPGSPAQVFEDASP